MVFSVEDEGLVNESYTFVKFNIDSYLGKPQPIDKIRDEAEWSLLWNHDGDGSRELLERKHGKDMTFPTSLESSPLSLTALRVGSAGRANQTSFLLE
jgi:hypothetical protein